MAPTATVRYLLVGLVAGVVSGLLGVGGGIVIVPMLVLVGGLSQHQAHATSLAGVIPIATVGAATYFFDGKVDLAIGAALAAGAVAGAPLGARLMSLITESSLKIIFGFLLLAMGVFLVWK